MCGCVCMVASLPRRARACMLAAFVCEEMLSGLGRALVVRLGSQECVRVGVAFCDASSASVRLRISARSSSWASIVCDCPTARKRSGITRSSRPRRMLRSLAMRWSTGFAIASGMCGWRIYAQSVGVARDSCRRHEPSSVVVLTIDGKRCAQQAIGCVPNAC